jgi:hypothetical protein|tara:strand:- start:15383 stop:15598 length:216 start_codon:yes stop_codon:yes gene_type:complete
MRSRYPKFKVGDLVKLKSEFGQSMYYGVVMQIGEDGNWDFDERYVRVCWAVDTGAKIREERIRQLVLVSST